MNYELAKELKDAGFPQKGNGSRYTEQDSPAGGTLYEFSTSITRNDNVYKQIYVPTLSELVEACGDVFAALEKRNMSEAFLEERRWLAWGHKWEGKKPHWVKYEGNGSTSEEAVARLWLALNTPSTMNK